MEKKKTSIVFTGDIGFDRYMDHRWEDEHLLSAPVLDFFHSADHTVANVEGALIDAKDDGSRGVFFHSMNPAATRVLKDIHADIWSIGNNHTMDAGREGVMSTKKIAEEMGCLTMGAGMNDTEASEPVYLDEAGGIGMFCVAYQAECIPATATEPGIFRWDDLDLIAKRIAEIKSRRDRLPRRGRIHKSSKSLHQRPLPQVSGTRSRCGRRPSSPCPGKLRAL